MPVAPSWLSKLTLVGLLGCATNIEDASAPLRLTLEHITDDPNIYRLCDNPGTSCAAAGGGHQALCSSLGAGLQAVCLPGTGLGITQTNTAHDDCPQLVGPYTQKRLYNVSCVIECEADASDEPDSTTLRCPSELPHCQTNPFSAASRYEASRFCAFEDREAHR